LRLVLHEFIRHLVEQSRFFALPSSLNCSGWKICPLTLILGLPAITELIIEFWKGKELERRNIRVVFPCQI
jgi:hypothetical protein